MGPEPNQPRILFTIGHSTRSLSEFIDLLRGHGVRAVADVRRFPRSRRHPHFNDESLARALPLEDIAYLPSPALGGRRAPDKNSINTGWRNNAFRGYADYMQTAEFATALQSLIADAQRSPTAIMCAEALPWQCHRSLIADAFIARGWQVLDIMNTHPARPHVPPAFARIAGEHVTYPAADVLPYP